MSNHSLIVLLSNYALTSNFVFSPRNYARDTFCLGLNYPDEENDNIVTQECYACYRLLRCQTIHVVFMATNDALTVNSHLENTPRFF